MKTNINTAINIINILSKNGMEDIEGIIGYALYKNLRKLQTECADFYKMREKLIIKYGKKDGENYAIDIEDKDNYNAFINAIEPLLNLEIEIDFYQVSQAEFDELCCPSLSTREYMILEQILVKFDDSTKDTNQKEE